MILASTGHRPMIIQDELYLMEDFPHIWTRMKTGYRIATDEMIYAPAAIVIRFDVPTEKDPL